MTEENDNESRLEDVEQKLVYMESRLNHFGKSIDTLEDRVDELEKENRELMNKLVEKVNTTQELEVKLSDAERIYHLGWDEVNINETVQRKRAMTVIENWKDWSEKGKEANSITFSQLVERLDTILSVNVEYKTVSRVAEAMEQLSDGKFQVSDSSMGKRVYHYPDEEPFAWELDQIVNEVS